MDPFRFTVEVIGPLATLSNISWVLQGNMMDDVFLLGSVTTTPSSPTNTLVADDILEFKSQNLYVSAMYKGNLVYMIMFNVTYHSILDDAFMHDAHDNTFDNPFIQLMRQVDVVATFPSSKIFATWAQRLDDARDPDECNERFLDSCTSNDDLVSVVSASSTVMSATPTDKTEHDDVRARLPPNAKKIWTINGSLSKESHLPPAAAAAASPTSPPSNLSPSESVQQKAVASSTGSSAGSSAIATAGSSAIATAGSSGIATAGSSVGSAVAFNGGSAAIGTVAFPRAMTSDIVLFSRSSRGRTHSVEHADITVRAPQGQGKKVIELRVNGSAYSHQIVWTTAMFTDPPNSHIISTAKTTKSTPILHMTFKSPFQSKGTHLLAVTCFNIDTQTPIRSVILQVVQADESIRHVSIKEIYSFDA